MADGGPFPAVPTFKRSLENVPYFIRSQCVCCDVTERHEGVAGPPEPGGPSRVTWFEAPREDTSVANSKVHPATPSALPALAHAPLQHPRNINVKTIEADKAEESCCERA